MKLDALAVARAGAVGRYWTWVDEPCASWLANAADAYAGPWDRRTAHAVLVIGNTLDPATPYERAVAMARLLARARLLTVDGFGHTSLLTPSTCAKGYVSDYFIAGKLPPSGSRCEQDERPFVAAP